MMRPNCKKCSERPTASVMWSPGNTTDRTKTVVFPCEKCLKEDISMAAARVLECEVDYGQNTFGTRTGNRARKLGIYKCRSCGKETTLWLDYGRLPVCGTCNKDVEWEFVCAEVNDVSQAGH